MISICFLEYIIKFPIVAILLYYNQLSVGIGVEVISAFCSYENLVIFY